VKISKPFSLTERLFVQRESVFERKFLDALKTEYPDSFVMKNDSGLITGIPDRTFLVGTFWAMLEFKRAKNSAQQANQDWYIEKFKRMSFAAFVCPANAEDVMYGLQQAYQAHRDAFFPKS
jgi:hypothetical protein